MTEIKVVIISDIDIREPFIVHLKISLNSSVLPGLVFNHNMLEKNITSFKNVNYLKILLEYNNTILNLRKINL